MKHITTTYLSDDCTRKATLTVDKNGHYHLKCYKFPCCCGENWTLVNYGRSKFKHIESAQRAANKFIQ